MDQTFEPGDRVLTTHGPGTVVDTLCEHGYVDLAQVQLDDAVGVHVFPFTALEHFTGAW